MEPLFPARLGWADLEILGLVLVALYFLFQLIERFSGFVPLGIRGKAILKQGVHTMLLLYEPLVVILLAATFLLVNPVLHGIILGVLGLVGFTQLRNYLHGRLIQFDPAVRVGNRLRIKDVSGMIARVSRLGIYLKTTQGLHFFNYASVFDQGYVLLAGDTIGGYHQIPVVVREEANEYADVRQALQDLLIVSPFVDWRFPPEVVMTSGDAKQFEIKINVREEYHLRHLATMLEEKGFSCELTGTR
ncbi:MAG: hypothetical protein H6555_03940 [Lewinellaceae bacterium]|nr:hypothetical protein [Lewinellaceae bacterium]